MDVILKWIYDLEKLNMVCDRYANAIKNVHRKEQLFFLACDSNGINFCADMFSNGFGIDYETVEEVFCNYINGQVKPSYDGYDSCMFVGVQDEEQIIDTTLCCMLGVTGDFVVKENGFPRIVLDGSTNIKIQVMPNARAVIEYYGNAEFEISGDTKRVKIIKHGE